jgi:Ca-activated chloride channel family protein
MTPLRVVSLVVRIMAIAIVVAAPWLRPQKKPSETRAVVYVVDRSASIGETGLEEANAYLTRAWAVRGAERLGVIAFDGRAELVARIGAPVAPFVRASTGDKTQPGSSDLAAAVRLATASLPNEGHRSIVLLTDARPTRGDAPLEVRRAAEQGIRVDVVPLDGEPQSLPMITALKPRAAHVAERQPVAIDVDVRHNGPFVLTWTRDGTPLPPRNEYLPRTEDTKTVELLDPTPPPGVHVYEVKVAAFGGWRGRGAAGDDEKKKPETPFLTAVSVEGKAYAAVFAPSDGVPPVLAAALAESGMEARALPIERASDPAAYTGADLVVLADVRVSGAAKDDGGFTRAAQTSLVEYVQQGGGLLVSGGAFGLAPEYAGTPIARAIPVEIEDRGHVEDPPVALAIMLDRSGSMGMPVGSHTKIELAVEASLAAADVLRPTDQVALGSVDTETHWDVPLGPQARIDDLRAEVRKVTAGGGGIYVFTALRDAYQALERVKTPVRHVILFSDTSDSEEQFDGCMSEGPECAGHKAAETLANEARARGITTTVVGIGEGTAKDTDFLRRVATAAGGRFYLTTEGADLRRIFLSETRVLAQSNLREKTTTVAAAGPHPVLEGVNSSALPVLAAYVEAGQRAGADTALSLADGSRSRPFLATWRYGLGKAGAITTDFTEGWGNAWASSPDAAKVLRQTLRFLVRQNDARRADATVRVRDRVVEVDIELPPDAPESAAPKAIDVFAVDAGGRSKKIAMKLEQRGPGRWAARGRGNGEPIVIVRARDARGALMAEGVGREDRAPELGGVGADTHLAAELANVGEGRLSPSARDTLDRTRRPASELVATWPYALVAAAMLVLLDLVLRRFGAPKRGALRAIARPAPNASAPEMRSAA